MKSRYPNRVNTDPWRKVVKDQLLEGRGGVFRIDSRGARWYELTLECGHEVERTCRYTKIDRRQISRSLNDALPAPKKVRCEFCGDQERRSARG
jgi:hypothetical protein